MSCEHVPRTELTLDGESTNAVASEKRTRRRIAWIVATLAAIGGGAASISAYNTLGSPFVGLLVDPYATYSDVRLASWGEGAIQLHYPDRLVSVNGNPIGDVVRYGDFPLTRFTRTLSHPRESSRFVDLVFDRQGQTVNVRRPLREIAGEEVIFLFGIYALVGAFTLWSGLLVYLVSGRRPAAHAYFILSIASYFFMLTLFDYHTRAQAAPIFNASMATTGLGCARLALVFPEAPKRGFRYFSVLFVALVIATASAVLWISVAPLVSHDSFHARITIDVAFRLSLVAVTVSMLIRIRTTRGRDRAQLLSALPGLVLAPALIVIGILARGSLFYLLLLPCMISLLPFSVGYALVRHNILESTVVLTRRMMIFPIIVGASIAAAVVWREVSQALAMGQASLAIAVTAGAAVFGLFLWAGHRLAHTVFFPAAAQFRPTIEMLTDELGAVRGVVALRDAIEAIVAKWLPTTSVRVLQTVEAGELHPLPSRAIERLTTGELIWTTEAVERRRLLVPMRSFSELRAVIDVAPKLHGALFTSEDIRLLQTIAGLGAVALHNAENLSVLEELRRAEVRAARDDKQQALAVLGAEASHEITYSLNYFRYLLKAGRVDALEPEDVAIGREEIDRLQRMVSTLQRFRPPPLELGAVSVAPVIGRVLELLRGELEDGKILVEVDVDDDLVVTAAVDPLLQVFANLVRNAAQATGNEGRIGVRQRSVNRLVVLEVWDDGPGMNVEDETDIFRPWVSHRPGGLGLGLAITHRIVQSFGWTILFSREGGRTCFRLLTTQHDRTREAS
jgi:signal transduction histidine kinase